MSDISDYGGPAFPNTWTETNEYGVTFPFVERGMSLRDYFAGQALTGLLSGQYRDTSKYNYSEVITESFDATTNASSQVPAMFCAEMQVRFS